jgi:hypothetical protein
MSLPDEERAWLTALHQELWPPKSVNRNRIVLQAERTLLHDEQDRIVMCITDFKLVTSMASKGMFGGYALELYDHEQYPGTGSEHLLTITEDHLPGPKPPVWCQHLDTLETPPKKVTAPKKKQPGCGTDEAWEFFSRFTHSPQNREWLKKYHLPAPRERTYYDY